mgnify:CR=1 FL=1
MQVCHDELIVPVLVSLNDPVLLRRVTSAAVCQLAIDSSPFHQLELQNNANAKSIHDAHCRVSNLLQCLASALQL